MFKSHNPKYADGGQLRDFVFVEDCCDVMLWLLDNPTATGLFNLGTGKARSFLDLASAVYRAVGRDPMITFRDTPEDIRGQYQYFTEARMNRSAWPATPSPSPAWKTASPRPCKATCRNLILTAKAPARMYAIAFPAFDPVIFSIGPVAIRWYALAYIGGLFAGIWYARWMVKHSPALMTPTQVDDFLLWVLAGIVIGGRLGYVLFYKPGEYFDNPIDIFKTWQGGMSFHGALLAVTLRSSFMRAISRSISGMSPISWPARSLSARRSDASPIS